MHNNFLHVGLFSEKNLRSRQDNLLNIALLICSNTVIFHVHVATSVAYSRLLNHLGPTNNLSPLSVKEQNGKA